MPDALEKAYGYHIYFWSNEGEPLEQENNNDNILVNDLKKLVHYVSLKKNIEFAKKKWVEHFGEISYVR